jgi:hypothetical protein
MSKQTERGIPFADGMISAEFVHSYNAQAREIIDAITAVMVNAQVGLHLLRAQSLSVEQVGRVLDSIANDSKRAGEIVVRTRALIKSVAETGGAADR